MKKFIILFILVLVCSFSLVSSRQLCRNSEDNEDHEVYEAVKASLNTLKKSLPVEGHNNLEYQINNAISLKPTVGDIVNLIISILGKFASAFVKFVISLVNRFLPNLIRRIMEFFEIK